MGELGILNNHPPPPYQWVNFLHSSMREIFLEWLSAGNAKKIWQDVCVPCLDKVSEYAIHEKICSANFWDITQYSIFKSIYLKVLCTKLLRITDGNTYKVFIVAGQLYLKFLKKKPWTHKVSSLHKTMEDAAVETRIALKNRSSKPVDPEDVIAWLITQSNTHGTPHLKDVVRQYMSCLHSAPLRLASLSLKNRDPFTCLTPTELNVLWNTFKTASNYKQVNSSTEGAFKAGLECLLRYLEDLESKGHDNKTLHSLVTPIMALEYIRKAMLAKILLRYFSHGFRSGSPIELLRLRRFAAEDFGEELIVSDEALNTLIVECGTLFDGKVYLVRADAIEKIKTEIDTALAGGAEIIFYGAFYSRNEDWLFPAQVVSDKMLKKLLVELYPQFAHKTNYLSPESRAESEPAEIGREAFRVWSDDVLLTYEQLSERLPYIPADKIKYVLAQNRAFIWNAEGVYTHAGKVEITGEERAAISCYVAAACNKDGYASLANIPLGGIAERNYELSPAALRNAAFEIILADEYDKRDKIITHKGDTLNALSIMKEYCRSIEQCSLQDLLDFGYELTGETHRRIPMEAGYAVMVRADKETYVAEQFVHFDVLEIDAVLDTFISGDYLPLKNVTTFAAFPHCGRAWNLFLLESYCRRFSGRFRFEALAFNSRNTGVVIRKTCALSYFEIMADAVAGAGVALEKSAIEDFLFHNGYLGRRSYADAGELIERVKKRRS